MLNSRQPRRANCHAEKIKACASKRYGHRHTPRADVLTARALAFLEIVMNLTLPAIATLVVAALFAPLALADEAAIRKNIPARVPNFPKIDEVTKTAIPGLYEQIGRAHV